MKSIASAIFKTFFLGLAIIAQVHFAFAVDGGIIPNGKATFLDQNGKPLTNGKVYFYIPSTNTPKATYQDIGQTILNSNPVTLDGAGRALIWGTGSYRQIVNDRNGNLVWDVTTSANGSGSGGSTATGDGDLVGTIKPWAGITAPNQYLFAYGQELSRATYSALFTAITSAQGVFCTSGSGILSGVGDTTNVWIGMTIEVPCVIGGSSTVTGKTSSTVTLAANSNVTQNTTATFFYWGHGNGSTTFNLPDLRGVAPVGNNNMGGVASANLTSAYFGTTNPNSIGAFGGNQVSVIATGNLPAYTPSGSVSTATTIVNPGTTNGVQAPTGGAVNIGGAGSGGTAIVLTANSTSNFTGTPQGGSSIPFANIPPSKTINYIIKVTPDSNSSTASGVTSLGGQTGDIACVGALITCTGNNLTISNPTATNVNFTQSGLNATTLTFDAIYRNKIFTPEMFGATPSPFPTAAGSITNNQTQIQNAINALSTLGGGTLQFGPGVYGVGNGLSVPTNIILNGQGVHSTTLLLQPTVPTAAVTINAGPLIVANSGVKNMSINSADTTTTKIGIIISDCTQCFVDNVMISAYPTGQFTATAGAVGIQTLGRELGLINNVQIYADEPIEIGQNIHVPNTGEDLDSWTFKDLTLAGQPTTATKNVIQVDASVSIFNTRFEGHQNWIGGVDGFNWPGGGAIASFGLWLSGIKSEQSGNGGAGFTFNIAPSNMYGITIRDSVGGDRGGIRLRNMSGGAFISNFSFSPVGGGASTVGLDINGTDAYTMVHASNWITGTTASIVGQGTLNADPIPAGTSAIPPSVTYTAGTLGIAFDANPANANDSSVGSQIMMGFGSTCKFTPVRSTRVSLSIKGSVSNSVAGQSNDVTLRYGTGTAPINGAATAGTAIGNAAFAHSASGGYLLPFTTGGIVTGLTIGTAYWFDSSDLISGGVGTLQSIDCSAFEIP